MLVNGAPDHRARTRPRDTSQTLADFSWLVNLPEFSWQHLEFDSSVGHIGQVGDDKG